MAWGPLKVPGTVIGRTHWNELTAIGVFLRGNTPTWREVITPSLYTRRFSVAHIHTRHPRAIATIFGENSLRYGLKEARFREVLSECGRGAMTGHFRPAGATGCLFCCIQGMANSRSHWVMRADRCNGQWRIAFHRRIVNLPPRLWCCTQSVTF